MKGLEERLTKLAPAVHAEMGDFEQAKIVAGLVRLSGTDVDAAVARTDDNDDELGLVFIWTPRAERWRTRRDLDPNVVEGLIEWRRIRDKRRGASSEFGHDFYEGE